MSNSELLVESFTGSVQDVLSEDLQRVKETAPIAQVAMAMAESHLPRIFVIDERGQFLGVVSQHDVVRHYLTREGRDPGRAGEQPALIRSLLTQEGQLSVSPQTPLLKAAATLAISRVDCLPVVNDDHQLLGVLTGTQILQKITGHASQDVESSFTFYSHAQEPRAEIPAYIRRANGDIVIPLSYLGHKAKAEKGSPTEYAVLGYDRPSGRILIKFVTDTKKPENGFRAKHQDDCLLIHARDFVNHFGLLAKPSAFDVFAPDDKRYLILTPR